MLLAALKSWETLARAADMPERLGERLREPLPGREAQSQFEPALSYGRHFGPPAEHTRQAAVAILLYPSGDDDAWHVALTVRTHTLSRHAGQISLPGGTIDAGETVEQAVLRELAEELAVAPDQVELLGPLSPLYLFASEFLIRPWVVLARARPAFVANSAEVAELLEVPLAHVLDPANRGIHSRRSRGVGLSVPHFAWGRHRIWGATSMILGELVAVCDALVAARSDPA